MELVMLFKNNYSF